MKSGCKPRQECVSISSEDRMTLDSSWTALASLFQGVFDIIEINTQPVHVGQRKQEGNFSLHDVEDDCTNGGFQ